METTKEDETDNNNSKMVISRRPLDWQLTKNSLAERGSYLLETGIWSDCTFIVGVQAQNIKVRHLEFVIENYNDFVLFVIRCSVATKCFWPWPLQFLKPCSLEVWPNQMLATPKKSRFSMFNPTLFMSCFNTFTMIISNWIPSSLHAISAMQPRNTCFQHLFRSAQTT